jgi:DNA invertase Pin-like site-specific DNA recombinase
MIRVYYRVSTEKQDFPMQENAILDYCNKEGIDYARCVIYRDFGISGTTTNRPEYQKLVTDISENDTVLVYEISRLWRDITEQSSRMKMFKAIGVRVLSVADGEIGQTINDKLMMNFKGVINEYEADRLKERINAGIAARKAAVSAGLKDPQKRGKDKKKRKTTGYKERWEKWRREHGIRST